MYAKYKRECTPRACKSKDLAKVGCVGISQGREEWLQVMVLGARILPLRRFGTYYYLETVSMPNVDHMEKKKTTKLSSRIQPLELGPHFTGVEAQRVWTFMSLYGICFALNFHDLEGYKCKPSWIQLEDDCSIFTRAYTLVYLNGLVLKLIVIIVRRGLGGVTQR